MKPAGVDKDPEKPPTNDSKAKGRPIYLLLDWILDLVNFVDFLTDLLIMYTLLYSEDVMWFCLTVVTILMPYIVAQIPYAGFKLSKNREIFSREKIKWNK